MRDISMDLAIHRYRSKMKKQIRMLAVEIGYSKEVVKHLTEARNLNEVLVFLESNRDILPRKERLS